jgi:hypothetical protein
MTAAKIAITLPRPLLAKVEGLRRLDPSARLQRICCASELAQAASNPREQIEH